MSSIFFICILFWLWNNIQMEYTGNLKTFIIPKISTGVWIFTVKHLPTNSIASMEVTFTEKNVDFSQSIIFKIAQVYGYLLGSNKILDLARKDQSEFNFTIKPYS